MLSAAVSGPATMAGMLSMTFVDRSPFAVAFTVVLASLGGTALGLFLSCLITILILIHSKADKDIIMALITLAGGFGGALTRGITHQPQQTDSTQTVSSTTTVKPKE